MWEQARPSRIADTWGRLLVPEHSEPANPDGDSAMETRLGRQIADDSRQRL
jgi:hypothetical protein